MDWKSVFSDAKEEFEHLRLERKKLEDGLSLVERRIEAVRTTMRALAPIVEEELPEAALVPPDEASREWETTDSIRSVLEAAGKALSTREVSDALAASGWQVDKYTNPLSTIHTVLRRLIKYGEVKEVAGGEGPRFLWVQRRPRGSSKPNRDTYHGLRDLCWNIVNESAEPLTAEDIATALVKKGLDATQYANLQAVIYAHLNHMPDRVRSFKKRAQHEGKWQTYRYYEAIR